MTRRLPAQVDTVLSVAVHAFELYLDDLGHRLSLAAVEAEMARGRTLLSAVASVLGPRHAATKLAELRLLHFVEKAYMHKVFGLLTPTFVKDNPSFYPNVYEAPMLSIAIQSAETLTKVKESSELRKLGKLLAADTLRWASRCAGRGRDGSALYTMDVPNSWPRLSMVLDKRAGK